MEEDNIQKIRAEILAQRKALPRSTIIASSSAIAARFFERATARISGSSRNIGIYRSVPGEFETAPLELLLRAEGHRVLFPRIRDRAARTLEFVEVPASQPDGSALPWTKGAYGIDEPPPDLPVTPPGEIDILIVPGVVFGENGERIGLGAGYYDRFLPLAPQALRVALCFDFQFVPKLNQNPWDQPVHWVITEEREVQTSFARNWLGSQKQPL